MSLSPIVYSLPRRNALSLVDKEIPPQEPLTNQDRWLLIFLFCATPFGYLFVAGCFMTLDIIFTAIGWHV